MKGRVESFDDRRGDGLVRSDEGEGFYFHCVNIADGSRSIDVGQLVSAKRGVGHLGRDEAFSIEKRRD
jgi:cold shock CspA family protein